ncbi:MAG TPA: hypothetical protein VEK07_19985 [Polyangiaceae bacterium]|nr:hypothetical protein [Polyangiaceae bacterium]
MPTDLPGLASNGSGATAESSPRYGRAKDPAGAAGRSRSSWLVPFALALAAASVTKVCFPFDGLYGQDAFAYFRYASALWPHLLRAAPLPTLYWPAGYPVTVALLLPLTGGKPLAGQIVSSLACAISAGATVTLVRQVRGDGRAPAGGTASDLLCGAAVALSGATIRTSQLVMADGLALGATAAAMVCAVRHAQTGRGGWLVGCALALAWGTTSRWLIGLLVLPIGAFIALHPRSDRSRAACLSRKPLTAPPRFWFWMGVAAFAGLSILVPQLVVAHLNPASLEKHEWLVSWSVRNAFKREFHTPDGAATYRLPPCVSYLVRLAWPDYFFPIFVPFVFLGAWRLIRERRWAYAALLVGWPVIVWAFLSGIPYENPRFLLPTLPAIGALLGMGLSVVPTHASSNGRRAVTAVVAAGIAGGLFFGVREHARLVARKNVDRDLALWLKRRVPPDADLLAEGPILDLEYYGARRAHELFSAKDAEIDALVSKRGPLFLLADADELKTQWVGLAPEQSFERLRRSPGLTVVATHPPFTLFRVGQGTP